MVAFSLSQSRAGFKPTLSARLQGGVIMRHDGFLAPRPVDAPVYSLVIPIFNEERVLPILLHRLDQLLDRLDGPAEVIFVDDGSMDAGGIVAAGRAKDDPRYRYLGLSRNFGHQVAISAGMDAAAGQAVVVMDADLQDPPEVVLDLVAKW